MLAGFDRKGLEASLVHMPFSHRVPILVPALCMREGEPVHESGKIPVLLWPDDEMPGIIG